MRYMTNGEWVVDSALQLPVRSWVGQTFSANGTAARVFIANDLPQFPGATSQPQVLAAISTLRAVPSHLLVLTDSAPSTASSPPPAAADRPYVREPGCCAVLGWYDDYTPLLQVRGWILAWDLRSGEVRRLTELDVNGVALGPGIRP
jgi:hypothetical protein